MDRIDTLKALKHARRIAEGKSSQADKYQSLCDSLDLIEFIINEPESIIVQGSEVYAPMSERNK